MKMFLDKSINHKEHRDLHNKQDNFFFANIVLSSCSCWLKVVTIQT